MLLSLISHFLFSFETIPFLPDCLLFSRWASLLFLDSLATFSTNSLSNTCFAMCSRGGFQSTIITMSLIVFSPSLLFYNFPKRTLLQLQQLLLPHHYTQSVKFNRITDFTCNCQLNSFYHHFRPCNPAYSQRIWELMQIRKKHEQKQIVESSGNFKFQIHFQIQINHF